MHIGNIIQTEKVVHMSWEYIYQLYSRIGTKLRSSQSTQTGLYVIFFKDQLKTIKLDR